MEISLVVWKNPNAAQEVCAEGRVHHKNTIAAGGSRVSRGPRQNDVGLSESLLGLTKLLCQLR